MSDSSDQGQSGNQGQAGAAGSNPSQGGAQGAQGTQGTQGGAEGSGENPNAARFLTKEVFKSSLEHWRRTVREDLDKIQKQTQESVGAIVSAEIAKALEAQSKPKPKSGKKDEGEGDANDLEFSSLKRKLEETEKAHQALRAELDAERTRAKDLSKRAKVIDALRRFDCTRPDVVYGVIRDELRVSEDGQTVFAIVKDEFDSEQKVPLDDFVRGEVAQKIVPELFKGANRGGSPAGGDVAGSGGKFKFTREHIKDPEFYRKNREAIDVAIQRGEVKDLNVIPMQGTR